MPAWRHGEAFLLLPSFLLVRALALLAGLYIAAASLSGALGATHEGAFEVPPFQIGEGAVYEILTEGGSAAREYEVLGTAAALDAALRSVDVLVLGRDRGEERVSLSSMTIVSTWEGCPVPDGNECTAFRSTRWSAQGAGGLFGATLVQGRPFEIGDSWEIEGSCLPCARPIRVYDSSAYSIVVAGHLLRGGN